MIEEIKKALGIDEGDAYYDNYLDTLILASESYIKELIPVEITDDLIPRYKITVIAMVTYMFNNREIKSEDISSNKVIKSLLNSLRYKAMEE